MPKSEIMPKSAATQKLTGRQKLRPECVPCLAGKYPNNYPAGASEEQIIEYQSRTLALLANCDRALAAPVHVRDMNDIREEIFGERVSYKEQKSYFNNLLLSMEDVLWKNIKEAKDPLRKAIQYAIIGNYIDFSALSHVDENYILQALEKSEDFQPDTLNYQAWETDLKSAKKLLVILDNCGEIVMDKLLIRLIRQMYPEMEITACVRGADVQNDASMEDAIQTGLCSEARVIDNGNNIAGCWLPESSPEFLQALDEADVILSKGQANLETMRWCGKNVYYIFLCKCSMLARTFGVPLFTPMMVRETENKW